MSKSDIWTIQKDQTETIFCKDKSNTYYFDIYLENGSVKSLSLYYTINNDVFDIAFDVSAFTNYNTGDIQYSKGGINVERNDISESDYEAYINELKPIEWNKLP